MSFLKIAPLARCSGSHSALLTAAMVCAAAISYTAIASAQTSDSENNATESVSPAEKMPGVRRVFAGGIEIFTNGTMLGIIAMDSATPDHLQQSVGLRVLESPAWVLMLQVGFVMVTLLEILSLLCLSSPWFRRGWLAVMLVFHVLSWPLLQTLFVFNILLLGLLLIDWDGIAPLDAVLATLRRPRLRRALAR